MNRISDLLPVALLTLIAIYYTGYHITKDRCGWRPRKSELKKIQCGIKSFRLKDPKESFLIGFRGALFFCFFAFGRSKEKKKDRLKMTLINTITFMGSKTLILFINNEFI